MKKRNKHISANFVPAGILIGIGFGIIYNNVAAGVLIGLGFGMAAWTLTLLILKKER